MSYSKKELIAYRLERAKEFYEDGKLFNKLFGLRQEADYEDFHMMEKEDVEPLLPKIESLLKDIEKILNLDEEE